jgi:hypothetical protein
VLFEDRRKGEDRVGVVCENGRYCFSGEVFWDLGQLGNWSDIWLGQNEST